MAKRTAGGKQHKRALSATSTTEATVKRPRKARSTPVKSSYFEGDSDDQDLEADELQDDLDSEAGSASDFNEEEEAQSHESSEPEEEDDDDDDDVPKRRRTTKKSEGKTDTKSHAKNGVEWKPGVKTGLGECERLYKVVAYSQRLEV